MVELPERTLIVTTLKNNHAQDHEMEDPDVPGMVKAFPLDRLPSGMQKLWVIARFPPRLQRIDEHQTGRDHHR